MVGTWASGLWKQHDVCDPARRWDEASQTEKVHTEVDLGAPSKKIIFFLVYFQLQVFQNSARKLDGQLTKRSTTFAQFLFIYFLKLLIRAGRCRQECRIRNIIVTYLDADLNDIVVNSSLPARRHLFSSAPPIVFLYPPSEQYRTKVFLQLTVLLPLLPLVFSGPQHHVNTRFDFSASRKTLLYQACSLHCNLKQQRWKRNEDLHFITQWPPCPSDCRKDQVMRSTMPVLDNGLEGDSSFLKGQGAKDAEGNYWSFFMQALVLPAPLLHSFRLHCCF